MKPKHCIATIECCFDKNRNGITFHGDKSARINLIADGSQLANNAKLLLLLGKETTFEVNFYEIEKEISEKKKTCWKAPNV